MDPGTYFLGLAASIWTVIDLLLKCRDRINRRRDEVLGFAKDSQHLSSQDRDYILREEILEDMIIVNLLLLVYCALLFVAAATVKEPTVALFSCLLGIAVGLGAIASIYLSWRHYRQWRDNIRNAPNPKPVAQPIE